MSDVQMIVIAVVILAIVYSKLDVYINKISIKVKDTEIEISTKQKNGSRHK